MKTKEIIAIGLLAIATVGFTSCSDSFLDVENFGADDLNEYYKTDAHLQEAVVAAYDPLHWADWGNGQYCPYNLISDVMSDDINVGGATASDQLNWQLMSNYNATPDQNLSGFWTDEYSGVKRCNDVVQYVDAALQDSTLGISRTNANYYKTQARVLRSFYYMWLWKMWGNIPYFTTNLPADSHYLGPQYSADSVYHAVITDLEDAINQNNLPMKAEAGQEGRVTKAFAYMIYAEMVMYQKDESRYPKALQYMQEIINSSQYRLNPDFAAIWTESGEWCDESIYEINYQDDNHVRGWSNPLGAGGTVLPRLVGPRGWTSGVDGIDLGWGFGPVRTQTVDLFAGNDTRKKVTAYDAASAAAANGIDFEHGYEYTGYYLGKYIPRPENNKDAGWDVDLNFNNNYRVYRYSETLLNAAELLLRTGGNQAQALYYVNQVRQRAGIAQLPSVTLRDVLNERHLEFVGEGKRYFDLIRTDQASTVLVAGSAAGRTNNWTENKKYLPIPQGELSADPNLKNNNY